MLNELGNSQEMEVLSSSDEIVEDFDEDFEDEDFEDDFEDWDEDWDEDETEDETEDWDEDFDDEEDEEEEEEEVEEDIGDYLDSRSVDNCPECLAQYNAMLNQKVVEIRAITDDSELAKCLERFGFESFKAGYDNGLLDLASGKTRVKINGKRLSIMAKADEGCDCDVCRGHEKSDSCDGADCSACEQADCLLSPAGSQRVQEAIAKT